MNYGDGIRDSHLAKHSEATEVVSLRNERSKTFDNKNGTRTLVVSTGTVHYKENYQNSKEAWKDIDIAPVDKGDHFLVEKSPLIVKIYKDKVGYEVTARRTGHKIKVELVDEKPKEEDVGFEVKANHTGVRLWKHLKTDKSPKTFKWKITEENKTEGIGSLKFREKVDAFDEKVDLTKPIKEDEKIKIVTKKTIIDSNSFYWEEIAPKTGIKIDTDVSYYSGSGDGNVTNDVDGAYNQTNWDTCHDASNGVGGSYTGGWCYTESWYKSASPNFRINRSFFPFDTSGLEDDCVIDSATLRLWHNVQNNTDNDGEDYIVLVESTTISTSLLYLNDFSAAGSTAWSDTIDLGDGNGNKTYTLNVTGLANINKTGFTKLATREGHDILDHIIADVSVNSVAHTTSDYDGTDYDPLLSITYHLEYEKALSDSQSITESLVRSGNNIKMGLVTTLSIAEALAKTVKKPAIADTISLTEALVKTPGKILAEAHSLAEAVANKSTLGVSDSITFAESKTLTNVFKRSLSDTLSIAEALAGEVGKTLADTHAPAEALAKTVTLALVDVITLADSEIEAPVKALTDSLSISEALAKDFEKAISDTLSIAESEYEATELALGDALGILESLANLSSLKISDSLVLAENLARTVEYYLSLSDEITFADGTGIDVEIALSDGMGEITEAVSLEPQPNPVDFINIIDDARGEIHFAGTGTINVGTEIAGTQETAQVEDGVFWQVQEEAETPGLEIEWDFALGTIHESLEFFHFVGRYVGHPSYTLNVDAWNYDTEEWDTIGTISYSLTNQSLFFALTTDHEDASHNMKIRLQHTGLGRVTDDVYIDHAGILISPNFDLDIMKGLSDSIALTEAIATDVAITKSDSVIIEAPFTGMAIVKNLSDVLSISEDLVTGAVLGIPLSDSLAFAEDLAFTTIKSLSDTFDLFDEVVKGLTLPFTEAVAIAETVANETTLSLSDSIPISESVHTTGIQTLSDSISFSESLVKDLLKSLTDSVSITEAEQKDVIVPFTESVPISEALANSIALSISNAISIAESSVRVNEFYPDLTDIQSIAEAKVKTIVKVLTDEVTFSDAEVEKEVEHLEDSMTPIIESTAKAIVKSLTESLSIADSEIEAIGLVLADSISISESVAPVTDFERSLADSVAFSEGITQKSVGISLTESLSIVETLANVTTLSLSDSVSITEAETELVKKPGLEDSVSIAEEIAKSVVMVLADSLSIAESSVLGKAIDLSDEVGVAESVAKDSGKVLSNALEIAESLYVYKLLTLSDSLEISESLDKQVEFYKEFEEAVNITEALAPISAQDLADSMSISESLVLGVVKNFTESITIAEEYETDFVYPIRLGRKTFLRSQDTSSARQNFIRNKYM